jgi:superfamily II DNA or RNA helicase
MSNLPDSWEVDGPLTLLLESRRFSRLNAYRIQIDDVQEHADIENAVLAGGYMYRQIFEVVQNGADAILEQFEAIQRLKSHDIVRPISEMPGISIALTSDSLYAANTGAPISEEGLRALLQAHSSPKRGMQIGRFGLGFKSLLALHGKIDVFSRSVSFRFDPENCQKTIRQELGLVDDHPCPGLRLAWPLDFSTENHEDPMLSEMALWATTIIRADVGSSRISAQLEKEMRNFPAEFAVFFPIDVKLEFSSGDDVRRTIRRQQSGQNVELSDGDRLEKWRTFEDVIPLTASSEVLEDATHLHRRDNVPISWAVPMSSREERAGLFWAFFPTKSETRVPGILNAPWKVNSDRTNLIEGPYNQFLMQQAAKLVAASLPTLHSSDDPGCSIDYFPRRIEGGGHQIALPFIDALWAAIQQTEIIPDCTGGLRLPKDLRKHPFGSEDIITEWSHIAPVDEQKLHIHPSCFRGQRAGRLATLMACCEEPASTTSLVMWLESATSPTLESCQATLELVVKIADEGLRADQSSELRRAKIILSHDQTLIAAEEAILLSDDAVVPTGRRAIDGRLLHSPDSIRAITEVLKVTNLDDDEWLRILNQDLDAAVEANRRRWFSDAIENAWSQFWMHFRDAPETAVRRLRPRFKEICVKNRVGEWKQSQLVLSPGEIIRPEVETRKARAVLIDHEFHADDHRLIVELGIKDVPKSEAIEVAGNQVPSEFTGKFRSWYRLSLDENTSTPQDHYLSVLETFRAINGWRFLFELDEISLSNLTTHLLPQIAEANLKPANFGHSTRSPVPYPVRAVPNPAAWALVEFGRIEIAGEIVPIKELFAQQNERYMEAIPNWASLLGGLARLGDAYPESHKIETIHPEKLWPALLKLCLAPSTQEWMTPLIYDAAARVDSFPDIVRVGNGTANITDCYVTSSERLKHVADEAGVSTVVLAEQTTNLWIENGANDLGSAITLKWDKPDSGGMLLLNVIPDIRPILTQDAKSTATAIVCKRLRLNVFDQVRPLPCVMAEDRLVLDADQLQPLPWAERIRVVVSEVSSAGWLAYETSDALRIVTQQNVVRRRQAVADESTLAERLLCAIGNDTSAILESFDEAVHSAISGNIGGDPIRLAELALRVHGPGVLAQIRSRMALEGLEPPERWGTERARNFVSDIGFPPAFAVSRQERRPSEVWMSGPVHLGELHVFQNEIVESIGALIASGNPRRRGIVSLPTGAGKTRVAVEAAIKFILKPEGSVRTVLWVAQKDELCEQAVQAFCEVWINHGLENQDLRIIRLWGGNPSPSPSEEGDPAVIVSTIQTLNSRIGTSGMDWFRRAGLTVVDESHHAIAPTYTGLLNWLNDPKEISESKERESPLLGLTATPFRGHDVEESRRLARRFDQHLMPPAEQQGRLYRELQREGFLSRFIPEPMNFASPFELTLEEKRQLETFHEFPEAAAARLGKISERNDQIVARVIDLARNEPVLLFANSVWHAQYLSARLNVEGVEAAAIHGDTDRTSRRYFVQAFLSGQIRVMCNYAVFTTGFDAPKTSTIVISPPVFSPVRYMQMVGRGLRGEKNGGTPECRIVTIVDNIVEYGDQLAYHYFEQYFQDGEA